MKHNRVISFFKTPVFIAKEYLHRRPTSDFNWHFVAGDQQEKARQHSATLETEGIVMLPAYFQVEQLDRLRQAFDKAVRGRDDKANPGGLLNEDILHLDQSFLDAALDSFLLEIIGGYYGKKFAIGRASAQRLHPITAQRYGSYQWHHDSRGRQVHVMIILNDLARDSQRMSYLCRTHQQFYDHYRGLSHGSRFEQDVVNARFPDREIVELAGPAGTVGIFYANGLHTGNRNENGKRDCLTFCYVSYRHWKPLNYRRASVMNLPERVREVVTFNPRHAFVD